MMENSSFDTQPYQSESSRRFDASSKTWIDFKSETDAMFASFWLGEQLGDKHLVSFDTIKALLKLLRNPRFHPEHLTYNDGGDVLSSIAASRRTAALARSMTQSESKDTKGQVINRVPNIVVGFVVQELCQSMSLRVPWSYIDKKYLYSEEETADRKTLKSMCLVHRSWTIPAQNALSRSINVSGPSGLYHLLRNPHFGPSTRVLCYLGDIDSPETSQLLSTVIRKCPGLRAFHAHSKFDLQDNQLFDDISGLWKLEVLDLGRSDQNDKDAVSLHLLGICKVLPKMVALKSLTLRSFMCRDEDIIPSAMHELSPSTSLTEANILDYLYVIKRSSRWYDNDNDEYHRHERSPTTIDCIAWLFKPRLNYRVTSAHIDISDVYELSRMQLNEHGLAILPALDGIVSLHIDVPCGPGLEKAIDLMARCPNAKHVRLHALIFKVIYQQKVFDCFPKTLESLELDNYDIYNREVDALKTIIQSYPQLRSLHLDGTPKLVGFFKYFCRRKGVDLSFSRM